MRERACLGKSPYPSITTAPRIVFLILNLLSPVLKNAIPLLFSPVDVESRRSIGNNTS